MAYSFYEFAFFFVIYAFLGWCLEVCFCTVNTGSFVNRGFLNGPVCPIYGFGMVIVLAVLTPVSGNIFWLFLGGMVLTSVLELVTGWVLKKVFHTSWWDYSNVPFNIGGYICLKFSLAWGLAVVLVMRGIQPLIVKFVRFIPHVAGIVFLCAAFIAFICDCVMTVNSILKLNRDLGRIAEIAALLHEGSERMAEGLGNTALHVDERLDAHKLGAEARLDIARAEFMDRRSRAARRLVRAFPNLKPEHHEAFEQLKEWLEEKNTSRRGKK